MNRKAILIESSNVEGQTDLPGARADIANWSEFLRSDLGGAWRNTEISILSKPYSGEVEKELKVSSDCYCFVAFSGHGCEGSIVLNSSWTTFPISKLVPDCERSTLIVDSCRGIEEAERLRFAAPIVAKYAELAESVALHASRSARGWILANGATEFSNTSLEVNTHYLRWRRALLESSKGTVRMLACSKGQGAGENPSAGGYYTSLLMQSAIDWNGQRSAYQIHSTKEAHDYAARFLPPQQTPEYSPLSLAFPFAVKA